MERELGAGHGLPPVARPARWPGVVRAEEESVAYLQCTPWCVVNGPSRWRKAPVPQLHVAEQPGRRVAQIDSRSAFAAARRRSLTSDSSRAARSMRSCCASVRASWLSACRCWLSARSLIVLSCPSIAATVRVSPANCPAMLAMSASDDTRARVYAENQERPLSLEGPATPETLCWPPTGAVSRTTMSSQPSPFRINQCPVSGFRNRGCSRSRSRVRAFAGCGDRTSTTAERSGTPGRDWAICRTPRRA